MESPLPFNPGGPGESGKLFGLPFTIETAEIVIIPVPWEVTVSYRHGTQEGPSAILEASVQTDLYVSDIKDAWKLGVVLMDENIFIKTESIRLRNLYHDRKNINQTIKHEINQGCLQMVNYVRHVAKSIIKKAKIPAVLGGDHSTPLGLIQALGAKYRSFGILQIDAHADLREEYEGFSYSHASIMHNVLKINAVNKLVQVGIRDFCEEEAQIIENAQTRIKLHSDKLIKEKMFQGTNWSEICKTVIDELPDRVYISFDIDGLQPYLCPNTGTPVPGGLSFEMAAFLISQIVLDGKEIIGFDLCEVSPGNNPEDEWDANVGARMLYHLISWTGVSRGKLFSGL